MPRSSVPRASRTAGFRWELTPEDFAAEAAYARHLRHDTGRSDAFTLVAPLGVAVDAAGDTVLRAR